MAKYFKDIIVIIFFFLPLLVFAVLMEISGMSLKTIIKELVFNGALLLIILTILLSTSNKLIKTVFTTFLFLFYSVLFIQIAVIQNFQNFIDNPTLYTVFETNLEEAQSFLNTYLKWYFLVSVIIFFFIVIKIISFYRISLNKHKLIFVLLVSLSAGLIYKFYECSVTLLTINTYSEYREFTSQLSKNITQKTSNYFTNVKNEEKEALYVVIIGESTSRRNMGIYDYDRDTNPELNKIKNELYLFNDVISPRTHTILSLDRVLSLGDFQNPDHNELGTVFQLANQAGFKTYWLSNQQPLGANETLVSLYAKATNEQYFVSNVYKSASKLDDVLLPMLDQVINDKNASKKVVFLHLKGTHIYYRDAYPSSFSYFNNEPKTKFPSKESFQTINEYDNAIRYNDYIVSEIIQKVKKQKKNSYVVYFSDHGDDVFQDTNSFGHFEGIGSNAMYEIPFILWLSEEYRQKNKDDFQDKLKRKYTLEDFIYSFSELSRIQFDQYQPEKSIFNNRFVYKKRMIQPGVNYDERN